MKPYIVFIVLVMLLACKDERKDSKSKITPVINDSLPEADNENYFRVDTPFFLQKDILGESEKFTRKDSCAVVHITLPKRNPDNTIVYKKIDGVRKEALQEYREVSKDEIGPCDDMHNQYIWVEPRHLYQTKRLISYVIRKGNGMTGGTSGFNHYAINFDLETKKEIQLSDFFRLKTHNDSFSLCEIISHSIGDEERLKKKGYEHEWVLYLESSFAFDSNYVYFFFDRYGLVGWGGPTGVIRKKFLSANINERYQ